jgi:hypothetical protein
LFYGYALDGYTDWRLQEVEALLAIVDYSTHNRALSTIFELIDRHRSVK